jgi:integrase
VRKTAGGLPHAQKTQELPTVLTQEQVAKIIGACDNFKHRLILMTTCAAGSRASEVTAAHPEDRPDGPHHRR